MSKIYIVTNYGGGANYTPSVFTGDNAEKEARKWMVECAADNARDAYEDDVEDIIYDDDHNLVSDSKEVQDNLIINNIDDILVRKNEIVIGDVDEGGNILQLFEVEI